MLLDITGCSDDELADGAALITEIGQFGPGGRPPCSPRSTNPQKWH
ncbi:hypothetical protein JW613_13045 [Streptomyces smyrnaeus]|uniref:Uncharacterized protein n=1 Tax=Streptomyces smyrnaeus TaxID=1387713 RepID=A0ABS3XV12_9ACTN|nr:hypothetical protein [Streptomyces smyrnaeus]